MIHKQELLFQRIRMFRKARANQDLFFAKINSKNNIWTIFCQRTNFKEAIPVTKVRKIKDPWESITNWSVNSKMRELRALWNPGITKLLIMLDLYNNWLAVRLQRISVMLNLTTTWCNSSSKWRTSEVSLLSWSNRILPSFTRGVSLLQTRDPQIQSTQLQLCKVRLRPA